MYTDKAPAQLYTFRSDIDETPLHFAAMNGSLEIIKLLIEKEAEVNPEQKNVNESARVRWLKLVVCFS